jgi:hypothetical protein
MAAQSERVAAEANAPHQRAIELVTDNGYSIIRSWERHPEDFPTCGPYHFIVLSVDGSEQTIAVEISPGVLAQIGLHTRGRLSTSNSFWICCAEKHLAMHLLENDECPRFGTLLVDILTPSDLNLSIRWERT